MKGRSPEIVLIHRWLEEKPLHSIESRLGKSFTTSLPTSLTLKEPTLLLPHSRDVLYLNHYLFSIERPQTFSFLILEALFVVLIDPTRRSLWVLPKPSVSLLTLPVVRISVSSLVSTGGPTLKDQNGRRTNKDHCWTPKSPRKECVVTSNPQKVR